MPGLSFLNKKSWHTTNVKNVERVWLAEQKKQAEEKKLAELQKQLEEERQVLELRRLQAASGQAQAKTIDNSLDWMYEGPMSGASSNGIQQQTTEEYLLGKLYKPQSDKATLSNNMLIANSAQQGNGVWLDKIASNRNDSFTRTHEDPFIMIKQQENKMRESILHNPLKMDKIREKISAALHQPQKGSGDAGDSSKGKRKRSSDEEKQYKKEKKARKAARKEEKRLKKEQKRSGDVKKKFSAVSDDESSVSSKSEKHRSISPEHRRRVDRDDPRRHDDRSRPERDYRQDRYHSSRDHPRSRYDHSPDIGHERRSLHDYDRNNRGRETDRRDHYRSNGSQRDHRRADSPVRMGESGISRSQDDQARDRKDRVKLERNDQQNKKRYGLLNSHTSSGISSEKKNYQGPDPELLRKKEEKEKAEAEARKNRTRGADVRRMTEGERMQKIAEMQSDASKADIVRSQLHAAERSTAIDQEMNHSSGNASFLESMRKEVYTGEGSLNMKSRLDQNKHYHQSSAQINSSENFLRKLKILYS